MIGVLDLQGGVIEHLHHLKRIGVPCIPVKKPLQLSNLAGLILPGGESTCLSRLIDIFGFRETIIKEYKRGMKIWGTCAGAILLAKTILGETPCLGLIDVEIERNSFGSQLDSFICEHVIPDVAPELLPLVFIRAPKIIRIGEGVKILLQINEFIAAAENPDILVTVFHPELTGSVAFHRYFARKCGLDPLDESNISNIDPAWSPTSWIMYSQVKSL